MWFKKKKKAEEVNNEELLNESEEVVEEVTEEVTEEDSNESSQEAVDEVLEESVNDSEEDSNVTVDGEVKDADNNNEAMGVISESESEPDLSLDDHEEEETTKKGFFARLKEGLSKTKDNMVAGVEQVFSSFKTIDEDFYEELEEALIMADLGVETSMKIIEDLRIKVKEQKISEPEDVRGLLKEEIKELMSHDEDIYEFINKKTVLLVIGVNGVGKTTTIGKLSNQYKNDGKKVLLAAGDTFRAAAIEQLTEWANRANVEIVAAKESTDPGAVVFDAVQAAKSRNSDILICDTAGRLHNKKNLMEELRKINKIIKREYEEANKEVLLVLDSTTGQNALQQAKQFKEIADINGIVLTKLDGTAKGGIAIAIQNELGLPVKYIGVGEGIDDLQKFDAKEFVDALFD